MLAGRIVRRSFDRANLALAGNPALQLRADFITASFLEGIGATGREKKNCGQ
jgi:hypothetical protein